MTRHRGCVAVVLALLAFPAAAGAVRCERERCQLHRQAAGANGAIASGPDGALWFAGQGFAGRMTVTGSVTRFPAPVTPASDVASGVDGAVWFTVGDGRVARVTPDGAVSVRPTGLGVGPASLAGAPDGAMWFAAGRTVGWVTVGGRSARYQLPPSGAPGPFGPGTGPFGAPSVAGPGGLALGPDGAMWVAEQVGRVHRVTPDGRFATHTLVGFASLGAIAAGPDGGMWVTGPSSKAIWRVSAATGEVTLYRTSQRPLHIVAGPSRAVWFAMRADGRPWSLVRMTPSGFQTFFQVAGWVHGLAVGANQGIFMTKGEGIERLTPFLGARPIRTRALRVNPFAGSASLRLFCPKYDLVLCAGRITLHRGGAVIGGAPFSQRVNDAPATRLVLNARGRALTRRPVRLRTRMTIVQHDQGGTTRRSVQNLYLLGRPR